MAARNHSALFVLVTIFIDAIGFGLIMPVLPQLLMTVGRIDLSHAIGIGAWMGLAMATVADVSTPEDRAKTFGFVSAAFGVGFVLGPALGGLLGEWGPRAPCYVASGMAALNVLYGLLVFPETLTAERRRAFSWRRANPLGALATARAVPGMMGVIVVLILWQIASLVYPLTWSFYAIAQLGWSISMIGLSLAAVGITIAVSQIFITGPAVKRFGERDAATIGLIVGICGFIAYTFVRETWQAFAAMACIALQGLVQPSLMAMLSRRATPETQGEVQGISSMAMGIGSIIGPLALTAPMAYFTSAAAPIYFPGAAFVVAAVAALIALFLLRQLPRVQPV